MREVMERHIISRGSGIGALSRGRVSSCSEHGTQAAHLSLVRFNLPILHLTEPTHARSRIEERRRRGFRAKVSDGHGGVAGHQTNHLSVRQPRATTLRLRNGHGYTS
jgi:hypothetical protein